MIDGVGVRLGPLCDRLLKPHAGSLIEGRELSGPELFLEPGTEHDPHPLGQGGTMYCDLYFHSGKQISIDAGDALSLAIVSAINGREASVYHGDELVWFVEVDTKVDDDNPHHPAIVHFRGASLAGAPLTSCGPIRTLISLP